MIRAAATSLIALMGLACASPTAACSMRPGYKVPSNLDLAVAGETIVIATVEGERGGDDSRLGTVITRPTVLLKGKILPDRIELDRAGLGNDRWKAQRSDPRELREPNPDALSGGCVRYTFDKGMQLVLFLKRGEDGKLAPYRSAFSRDAEDVTGPDALWVRAVREYSAISMLPKPRRKARLKARIAELRAMPGDPGAAAIADDLQIELSGKQLGSYD